MKNEKVDAARQWRAVLAALLLAAPLAAPLSAQERAPAADSAPAPREVRLFVEILDAKGKVAEGLQPADLEIREGGRVLRPAAIEAGTIGAPKASRAAAGGEDGEEEGAEASAAPGATRVLVWFDPQLSSPGTVRQGAEALGGAAKELAALGDVELLSAGADGPPESVLRTADAFVVAERLSRMALTERGLRRPQEIRAAAIADLRRGAAGPAPMSEGERRARVRAAIEEEVELVAGRLDLMASVVLEAELPGSRPLLLLPVFDGWDLDPLAFWAGLLEPGEWARLQADPKPLGDLRAKTRRLAETLAAAGFTVWPVAPAKDGAAEKAAELTGVIAEDGAGKNIGLPGVTIKPGLLFGKKKDEAAEAADAAAPAGELAAPLEPLELLAKASGGEVLGNERAVRDAALRFSRRLVVRYASGLSPEEGVVPLEVLVLRPGFSSRAAGFRSAAAPPALAGIRLGRVLRGEEDEGGLAVAAVLRRLSAGAASASLEARVDLREFEGETRAANGTFRVSLELVEQGKRRPLLTEVMPVAKPGEIKEWVYRREVELEESAGEVLVLLEDLDTGRWGGQRASIVTGVLADAGDEVLPPPRVIELQSPADAVLRGRVKFETEVFDAGVARVVFLLDDREVAEVRQPPFAARLDLGRTPRRQTLAVVAYDSSGRVLGRDSYDLNSGDAGFGVTIVSPKQGKGTGPIEVEATVAVPADRKIDRVLFFWNNESVATLFAPPFRQKVVVPADKPVGYVRVVALLDDGSLAEDVVFMNGPMGERVDVRLVELFVVVAGQDGRPVRGLTQDDFGVREEGVPQQIASFQEADDVPLTLGLAVDSSASMFVKLPLMQKAVVDFLGTTFRPEDRAFVVDFDDTPRLVRPATSDLERLKRSIDALEASGHTALWEAIVYSLVQLQGTKGRKALIVFSDGADEDEQFPFRSTLRISREMGVPIYLVLMRKKPEQSAAAGLITRSFTSRAVRLAEATGGRVFYAKEYDNLDAVYDEIEAELRSQYLITYYPKNAAGGKSSDPGYREVDVAVRGAGLRARTLNGYLE
jgi:Ca-activated chloride channel family protein